MFPFLSTLRSHLYSNLRNRTNSVTNLKSNYNRSKCLFHGNSAGFVPKSTKWVTEEETKNFKSMFPYLVKDLTNSNVYEINPDATKRLINALEYNVPHGKMVCGLVAVAFYKAIEDPAKLTNENIHLANILGWCVHLNDFMDCFGDSNVTGKFGSDIEDGKCTWLIIQALQRGSQTQRNILENNYGKGGSENVAAVRSVYEDLKLSNIYGIFEEKTCALIGSDIEKLVSDELQHRFFRNFLNSIYKSQS